MIGGAAHTAALQAQVVPNMSYPVGLFVPLAAAIKAAVPGIPVFHASRIVDKGSAAHVEAKRSRTRVIWWGA